MNRYLTTIVSLSIFLFAIIISGFKIQKDSFTDFYYYNNEIVRLVLVQDQIFIELDENIDEPAFNNLLSKFPELNVKQNFDLKDKKDFVFVNESVNETELKSLINKLNERAEVSNASPVFRMPDGQGNSNTLIGVEKEIIAQFRQGISDYEINSYLNQKGMNIVSELDLSGGKSYIIRIPEGEYSIDYANELYLTGLVNYSEPNLYFTNLLCGVLEDPNDPYFPQQWSHRNTGNNIPGGVTGVAGCDMKTDSTWIYTMGDPSVIVSMVDTGIDTLHEDLSDRIIHGLSIDTYNNLPYAWDDNNHGTATAGIVAATGNNNLGIIGVAPLSRIFGVKIFNAAGNTTSAAIVNGLIAAWQRGAWVSSNSWGGGSPISAADNAINDGVNYGRNGKGVVWCFATGNTNASSISWPSTNPNVISVGGISPCNQRKNPSSCDGESWWGAQYGTGLEIVAPAAKIYSTDRTGSVGYSGGNYVTNFNGTSSATPNVAGICALVLAVDSTLSWDVVRDRICITADKVGSYTYDQPGQLSLGGWNNQMGYGRVNAFEVVKLTVQYIPVELTSFTGVAIDNKVNLNWTTATETNNLGFEIERSNENKQFYTIGYEVGEGTSTDANQYNYVDDNPINGINYYRLKQVDYSGEFEYSEVIEVNVFALFKFSLEQNYPNPSTTIKYSLPTDGFISLNVYNVIGEKVADLINRGVKAGSYELTFNAAGLSSGIYFYKISAGSYTDIKKMTLIR